MVAVSAVKASALIITFWLESAFFQRQLLLQLLNESHLENCMKMARAQIRPAAAFLLDLEIRLQLRPAMLQSTIQSSKYNGGFFWGGAFVHSFPENGTITEKSTVAQNPFEYPLSFLSVEDKGYVPA